MPGPAAPPVVTPTDEVPVVFGHYWFSADREPGPCGPAAVCVDHSAGVGGPLVAYRWSPGVAIDRAPFVTSR